MESFGGVVVTGHFDPLLPSHATRLNDLASDGRGVMVVITDPPAPLLPLPARAELVAALFTVDRVILAPEATPIVFPAGLRLIREEARDAVRTRDLIRQVHQRQIGRQTVSDG
jgi:hypothetical protein